MRYYTDDKTKDFLASIEKKVYLYGGYDDPNNFGDIIQLKGALLLHSTYKPVILLSYRALKSDTYIDNLRQWFQSDYFIFIADKDIDVAHWDGIELLDNLPAGGLLHVYGGGYLNRFWGDWKCAQIESVIKDFEVDNYILSGIQIDETVIPSLVRIFEMKKPLLVGLRDKESVNLLKDIGGEYPVHYSFDDVTEIFSIWSQKSSSFKSFFTSLLKRKSVAWHLNLSSYAGSDIQRAAIIDTLYAVKGRYPHYSATVLHSFNERRPDFTADSMSTIVDLQEDFSYSSYNLINLATMALEINTKQGRYPNLTSLLANVEFGVTCSYHTSVLLSFFGKPTYLIASNEFYAQKRSGLGYEGDISKYLNNPKMYKRSFKDDIIARKKWIQLFEEVVNDR